MSKVIDVATEFSPRPFGRYRADGDFSAEIFREKYLKPALNQYDSVVVDLSGSLAYGSSFLEEVFGGLVRTGVDEGALSRLKVVHRRLPSIPEEVNEYIHMAQEIAAGEPLAL